MIQVIDYMTRDDGVKLIVTYDDRDEFPYPKKPKFKDGNEPIKGYMVRQKSTGQLYPTPIDVENTQEYEETDVTFDYSEPVPPEPEEQATEQDYIEALERLGV